MAINETLFSLSGIFSDGSEILSDGSPLESGIHLRWSFLQDLGFPSGGFIIERRFYAGEFQEAERNWEVLPEIIQLPDTLAKVHSRLLKNHSSSTESYKIDANQVVELVRQLRSAGVPMHKVPLKGGNQPKGKLYLLDFFLLASLDPVIAKVLGLYYVDNSVLPGTPVDYRVNGHWGETRWPKEEINFNKLTTVDLAPKQFSIGKVSFSSPRHLSLKQVGRDLILMLEGVQTLPLQLIFDHPVAEVQFELAQGSSAIDRVSARSESGILTSAAGGGLTTTFRERRLLVSVSDDKRFTELVVYGGAGNTSLQISKVNYWRFKGTIGNIYSNIVRLSSVNRNFPEDDEPFENIPTEIPSVRTIALETARPVSMPAMLGEDGNVIFDKSNVELSCLLPERSQDISSSLSQPVRMHIRGTRTGVGLSDVLTTTLPIPFAIPELIAFWKLNNLNATQRGGALILRTAPGESLVRFITESATDRIDRFQEKLMLLNPGYLETQTLTALSNLGSNLFIQLWVLPIGIQEAPALIGNNGNQSFRFGLVRRGSGYALRFYLNGTGPYDSSGAISSVRGIFTWTKVAVEYNGREVKFYINGNLSGTFSAAQGKVRRNPFNRLCIGCDPRVAPPTPSFDFPFRGYMADVQLWRSLFAYPSANRNQLHFVAGWDFQGNLLEEKTRTASRLIGNLKFITDHPQDFQRSVFYFDGLTYIDFGNSGLQSQQESELSVQLWLKPEPGLSSATLIGSSVAHQYSIDLVRHATGYQVRLTVNRATIIFRDVIPAGQWSNLTVGVNRNQAVLYINGLHGGNDILSSSDIKNILGNQLFIGAGSGSGAEDLVNPYKGSMGDVQIWNSIPAVPSPALLIDHIRTREDQLKREVRLKNKLQMTSDRRTPAESTDLSSLKIAWSFDGSLRDLKTCRYSSSVGTPIFRRGHPEDSQRKVLVLNGTNCVEFPDPEALIVGFGNQLTLKGWVNPDPAPLLVNPSDPRERERQTMTLISNNRETTFSFGLRARGTEYQLLFYLNGREFLSTTTILANTWSYIGVVYDGREVYFFIRKPPETGETILDPETIPNESNGVVQRNILKAFKVGAEVNKDNTRLTNAYRGKLADVEIWGSAPDIKSKLIAHPSSLPIPADFIAHHLEDASYQFQAQGLDLFGRKSNWGLADMVTANTNTPPLAPGGAKTRFIPLNGKIVGITKLTLPDDSEQKMEITVEGMNFDELNLADFGRIYHTLPDGSQRVLRGGKDVEVTRKRPEKSDQIENLEIESIRAEGHNLIFICILPPFARLYQEDTGSAIAIMYDYRFKFSWSWTGTQRLFSPNVNTFRFYQRIRTRKKNHDNNIITETPSTWDSIIDRSGEDSSPAVVAVVHSDEITQDLSTPPLVITKVTHSEWEIMQGNDPGNPAHRGIRWLPEPALAEKISLDVYRHEGRGDKLTVANRESKRDALASGYIFERSEGLIFAERQPNTVPLELFWSLERGDYFSTATAIGRRDALAAGYVIERTEGFLYSEPQPNTFPLQLYWHASRGDNYVTATKRGIQDAENTGYRFIRIEGHVMSGNTRMPQALLWRVSLPENERLALDGYRVPPQMGSVEQFVAGALVAYNESEDAKTWQHFQVVWHDWSDTEGWTLYIVQNRTGNHETDDDAPGAAPPMLPNLVSARYYPGQRYLATMALNSPPNFTPTGLDVLSPVGTIPYEIGIRTINQKGIESDTSNAALVAVDRQRPPKPPKPRVEIDKANFHGKSRAEIKWDTVGEGIQYQLLRAVDSAVIMRDVEQRRMVKGDLEQRRKNSGYYEGGDPPGSRSVEVLLTDDPDFEEWLQATFHPSRFPEFREVVSQWQEALFVEKPELPTADRTAWQLATMVWQAWADRYYPALQPSEFAAIAERGSNEKAFTLINSSPISETEFTDQVNGTVVNAYLYRLRSQSPSLLQSAEWGPVSDPVVAPKNRAPGAPVFTKIEAGDREVSLHWALNREKDLKDYRLYRARTREELEDLRWWKPAPPDKQMVVIGDPRVKVQGNEVSLPATLNMTHILGIFREDEYKTNGSANPPLLPFNYYRLTNPDGDPVAAEGEFYNLRSLRPIADGTAVAVIYRDNAAVEQYLLYLNNGPVYQDKGLLGLTDYYYRLLAIGEKGMVSEGSKIMCTQTLEVISPNPPKIRVNRTTGDVHLDQINLDIEIEGRGLKLLIQSKTITEKLWRTVQDWVEADLFYHFTETYEKDKTVLYRCWVKTKSGTQSNYSEVTTWPIYTIHL